MGNQQSQKTKIEPAVDPLPQPVHNSPKKLSSSLKADIKEWSKAKGNISLP